MNTYFDDSLRALPELAQMSPAEWAKIRTTSELQAHALLAYCATLQKDDAAAEAEYRKVLAIDPTQAATSYQLGAAILREIKASGDLARCSEALYSLARSLSVTGPNALPRAPGAPGFLEGFSGSEGFCTLLRRKSFRTGEFYSKLSDS